MVTSAVSRVTGCDVSASPDSPQSMSSFLAAAEQLDYSVDDASQVLSLHGGDFRLALRVLVDQWHSTTESLFACDQPTDSVGGNGDDTARCEPCEADEDAFIDSLSHGVEAQQTWASHNAQSTTQRAYQHIRLPWRSLEHKD